MFEHTEEEFNEKMLDDMQELGRKYAKAKGNKTKLEHMRKAVKSTLMKEAEARGVTSIQKQEREAYADFRYYQVIEALGIAQEEETFAWVQYDSLKIRFEKWRTERADFRAAANLR